MNGSASRRHPSSRRGAPRAARPRGARRIAIPTDVRNALVRVDGKDVRLTNLDKPFWRTPLITKGMLLQYYADVARVLLRICATAPW